MYPGWLYKDIFFKSNNKIKTTWDIITTAITRSRAVGEPILKVPLLPLNYTNVNVWLSG